METVSYCPLSVAALRWRHGETWRITVVAKATYQLSPGTSPLASEQEPVQEADEHWNGEARQSLRLATDLVPYKARAEVLLIGSVHGASRSPTATLTARLTVGSIQKAIEVFGDRAFGPDGAVMGFAPFVRMPLQWERAAGGPGTANPVGVRLDAPPDAYGMTPLPNFEPQGARLLRRGDIVPPACFAPLAPTWPLRLAALGRYATGWDPARWSERPLPLDLNAGYFNAAPVDQQRVTPFVADEEIHLEHLHPELRHLATRLAPIAPRAVLDRRDGVREEIPLLADTLLIDADRGLATLTWRGNALLWHAQEPGQIGVWLDRPQVTLEVTTSRPAAPDSALPFRATGEARATEATPPRALETPMTNQKGDTLVGVQRWRPDVLPFKGGAHGAAPPAAEPAAASSRAIPATPFVTAPIAPAPPPIELRDIAPPVNVQPPPRVGPLAKVEVGAADAAPASKPPEPKPPVVEVPSPEPAAPVEISLEEYAALCAEIVEGRAPRAEILKAHRIEERDMGEATRKWTAELERDGKRSRGALGPRYDQAYVTAVEGFRGPITASEYARVLVALERSDAGPTLEMLGIQRPALMPLVRIWTKKAVSDPVVGDELGPAIAAARARDEA